MGKVTRKPEEPSTVMEQPPPSTKGKKKKNLCQPSSRGDGNRYLLLPIQCPSEITLLPFQVKKIQRGIKRLLHGSSRKKSSSTITTISRKVKIVRKAKKFQLLTQSE
ncbi:spermatid nuclear transition protein 3 [Equus quagga]|uniref:spermatid nuclear transition protein 3 n=1 Tax=Equus quagga TaxID=89248 RepID=UPI001EE39812|nr:spermatid nuclear transition protein 3 [Equus quagga]